MLLYKDVLRCILRETAKISYKDCCSIRLLCKWISYDSKIVDIQKEWCKIESMKQLSLLKDHNLPIYFVTRINTNILTTINTNISSHTCI